MAKKKQSRLVAGQQRARERARRKAHYTGPTVVPTNATPTEADAEDVVEELELDDDPAVAEAELEPATAEVAAAEPHAAPRAQRGARSALTVAQRRRTTQAMAVASGPGIRSEVLRIGIVAALVGGALAVLKFGTDIGA